MNENNETATTTTFGLMKYVHVLYFAGAIIGGWLFVQIVDSAWTSANLAWASVPPPKYWLAVTIGGGAAAILALYMWRHPKVNRLAIEIVTELSKVTWPTRKELSASTVVVLVVSIIASIILGLFDAFWSWATSYLLTL